MAQNAVKTKNFALLDILRSLNVPFTIDQYSTLNEKFNIGNVAPPSSGYPIIQYLAIGRGGHANVVGSGNNTLVDILQHSVTDAALFEQIPFVLVPTSADLAPLERAKYRIRVLETYAGIDYFAYYLKVIPTASITAEARIIELSNGVITSDTAYVPSIASLSPTPVDISNTVINVVNGRHLVVQAVLPVVFDSTDIANIIYACVTKYGDIRYATISEIGVVGGFDISVTNNLGGVTATYLEIRSGQIMAFIGTIEELQQNPSSVTLQYALSNSMPFPPTLS